MRCSSPLRYLPSTATAAWHQPVGGADPVNQNPDKETGFPVVAPVGGVPYVAWNEEDTELGVNNLEVRVAQLNADGTAWTQPWPLVSNIYGGINRSATRSAFDVDLTAVGADPYVAWIEHDGTSFEVRVARLSGSSWVEPWTGVSDTYGGINQSTTSTDVRSTSLASVGGVPHVAWTETDGTNLELRVSRLNGATWQQIVGGASPINEANNRTATDPSLTDVGGVPYVAWDEPPNLGIGEQIRVKRLNGAGTAWEEPWTGASGGDGGINHTADQNGTDPSITSVGGVPYVAWLETDGTKDELRVARLNGSTWEEPWAGVSDNSGGINQSTSQSARSPHITSIGGVPYVAWREDDGVNIEERVARLNTATNTWEQVVGGASPINQDPSKNSYGASLAGIGGVPYVAWQEDDYDARVSRLEPEFGSLTATPSDTGATLAVNVHSYGIPYPVGFQFGTALEKETAAQATAAGSDNVTISQKVSGLNPLTTYKVRPFATAGAPAPKVFGATGSFKTLADITAPAFIGSVKADPPTFAVDPKGTKERAVKSRKRKTKKGTTFRYTLSEAARVVFTVERRGVGRKVGKKCRKKTASNRSRRKCTLFTVVRRFAQQATPGKNNKKFSGRIGNKRLSPAKYRASLVASDAAKNKSKAKRVAFRVVRGT